MTCRAQPLPISGALIAAIAVSVGAQDVRVTHSQTPPPGRPVAETVPPPKRDAPGPGMPGWPVDLGLDGAGFPYTPTLADVDGDGAAEIFLTGGETFGLRGDGSFLPGWPTHEMTYMGYGTNGNKPGPSAADVDGDGHVEVLWSERDWWAGDSVMWCFNGRNADGSDMDGYPLRAPDDLSNALDTPFVLADTDGDGDLEAWGAHTLGNNFTHYRVSALDHEGTILFTRDLLPDENVLALYYGDLDGDGAQEMFAVSWLSPDFRLNVFNADGSQQSGYPIVLHTLASGYLSLSPPVPFDLDRDGDLEILFGHWGSSRAYARCYHHDGSPVDGFPLTLLTQSQLFYLGLGDITGDLEPELIVSDNHLGFDYRVCAYDLTTGATLPGWPYELTSWPKGFPTIVDVDGDGQRDVCVATDSGELFALDAGAGIIDGYPKQMIAPSISGVGAGDIDGDGLTELVAATWNGYVYAWDTPAPWLSSKADWPMRGIDARNTGVYRRPCPPDVNGDRVVNTQDFVAFLNLWAGARPQADWNADGVIDTRDFIAYLSEWSGAYQGGGRCP